MSKKFKGFEPMKPVAAKVEAPKKLKIELVEQDWQYILNALTRCPYMEVNALLTEMQRQFSLQMVVKEATDGGPAAPAV